MNAANVISPPSLNRRSFLRRSLMAASTTGLLGPLLSGTSPGGQAPRSPIVVFSKVYQELNLGFAEAASLTAEAGLDGVDSPVRPAGEIVPERAAMDMPRYLEALRSRKLSLPLVTTAITGVNSPHTEEILRTAQKLGVQYYRLGFIERQKAVAAADQVREVRAQLKDLAALNRQIGIGALLQNHSPAGRLYFGGDLNELAAAVEGFDPAEIGVAFDIAHALVVHGDEWRRHFDRLRAHFKIAYVKDVKRSGRWVPFGQGDLAQTGYFKLLNQLGYHAPISLHIEFDWAAGGRKTRPELLSTLKASAAVLRQWLAQ